MDARQREGIGAFGCGPHDFVPFQLVGGHEEQEVLRVPEVHRRVRPNAGPDGIGGHVGAGKELLGPVLGPLLVHVPDSALVGHGGREDDDGSEPGQVSDKSVRYRLRQVLRDLQAQGEVEVAVETKGQREVPANELLRLKNDLFVGDLAKIDAENIPNATPLELSEPQACATSDVDDGARSNQADDEGNDYLCGRARAGGEHPVKVAPVEQWRTDFNSTPSGPRRYQEALRDVRGSGRPPGQRGRRQLPAVPWGSGLGPEAEARAPAHSSPLGSMRRGPRRAERPPADIVEAAEAFTTATPWFSLSA